MLPAVLGSLTRHEHIDEWLQSELVQVDSLRGHQFRFVFEESVLAEGDLDFSKAIENALRPGLNLLASAETDVFRYFQDTMRLLAVEAPDLSIANAADVWQHVDFGETIHAHRERGGKYVEAGVYLSVECSCEWEREHGLRPPHQCSRVRGPASRRRRLSVGWLDAGKVALTRSTERGPHGTRFRLSRAAFRC